MSNSIPNSPMDRLLIVEDVAPIRELYRDVAEDAGYVVSEAKCASSMSAAIEASTPTIILLDLTMPDADGLELLGDLAQVEFSGPVILASGQDEKMIRTAQRFGRMLGLYMPMTLNKPVSVMAITNLLGKFRQTTHPANGLDINRTP